MHHTIMSIVSNPSWDSPRIALSTSSSITALTMSSFYLLISESVSCLTSIIVPSAMGTFKFLLTKKKYRKEKPNQTLSKIHQPKNSRFPPSFGWSATSSMYCAERCRSQSKMLELSYCGLHPTSRTFVQFSCTGQQERDMFPITTNSAAVSNTQFPT